MNRKPFSTVTSAVCAALTLFCVGGGVMSAQAVSAIPVHDLEIEQVTGLYGNLRIDTTRVTADDISDLSGFAREPFTYGDGPCASDLYRPERKGASLRVHDVGTWIDLHGESHGIDMIVTVEDYLAPADFRIMYNSCSPDGVDLAHPVGFGPTAGLAGRPAADGRRAFIDFTIRLVRADGGPTDGIMGVTGFNDIDGNTATPNEAWELVSGFDGAWLRSDAHLTEYGENGWAGVTDEYQDPDMESTHALQHYLGATFTGDTFRLRYSVMPGDSRGSQFSPLNGTVLYPLAYDLNGGAGTIPNEP